jgi:MEKHLA domain-containing protein
MMDEMWAQPSIIEWSRLLIESFHCWTGTSLIAGSSTGAQQARLLFTAPVVVLSHGMEADPILNYGNQAALDLWEMSWTELTRTPSRQTAEPMNQPERARLLRLVEEQGYCDGYRGVRVSATGRRFLVEQAIVWNVLDDAGHRVGQAAAFSRVSPLP